MLASLFLLSLILFQPKRRPPQLFIISLSHEQILGDDKKKKSELFEFFCEKRFELNVKKDSYALVDMRKILLPKAEENILFTRDVSLFILTRVLTRRDAIKALQFGSSSILSTILKENQKMMMLKEAKKNFFSFTWRQFNLMCLDDSTVVCSNSIINSIHESMLLEGRNYSISMFWYSTNDLPFLKLGSNASELNLGWLKYLVDTHFIWNDFQRESLRRRGIENTKVVGSILFRKRIISSSEKCVENRILYFDVTPQDIESSFYTTAMAVQNIDDIVATSKEVSSMLNTKIAVSLKPKRKYFKKHSKIYIEWLSKLENESTIQILSSACDIYHEIKISRLVVAMPFTSPAQIALEIGVPSIYYCGLNEGWILEGEHYGSQVLQSTSDLKKKIIEIFTD
jgi:polysaccharide biosynthesis PFTS motif protein